MKYSESANIKKIISIIIICFFLGGCAINQNESNSNLMKIDISNARKVKLKKNIDYENNLKANNFNSDIDVALILLERDVANTINKYEEIKENLHSLKGIEHDIYNVYNKVKKKQIVEGCLRNKSGFFSAKLISQDNVVRIELEGYCEEEVIVSDNYDQSGFVISFSRFLDDKIFADFISDSTRNIHLKFIYPDSGGTNIFIKTVNLKSVSEVTCSLNKALDEKYICHLDLSFI